MLVTMAKIELIGPKKYFDKAVALLQQLGTLHMEDISKSHEELPVRQMDMEPEALESRNNLRNLLTRLNGIIGVLRPFTDLSQVIEEKSIWNKDNSYLTKEAENLLAKLEEKVRELASKKKNMELELTSLTRYEQALKKVYPLTRKIIPLEDSETVAFLLEGDYKDTVNAVNNEIAKLTEDNFELISTAIDEETTAAIIVFNKKYSAKVHGLLKTKVKEIDVPKNVRDLSVDKVIEEIQKKQQAYPAEMAKIDSELKPLAADYAQLKAISNAIHNRVEQIESIPNFAQTDYTFVLHAWLPQKELGTLQKAMKKEWGQKVLVRQLELTHHDLEEAPVAIENPAWASPFEIFMKIFQPPKYGTLDPTIFIAIFFPLFFGFIVGDMGYGLVVLITVTLLRAKFMKQKGDMVDASTRIFQFAGISTIIFGAFYGEAFGTLLEKILHKYHLLEKIKFHIGPVEVPYFREPTAERLMQLLYVSLAIGFVHLATSLVMGVINARREHAYKHMWEKIGTLGFMVCLGLVAVGSLVKGALVFGPESLVAIILGLASIGLVVYGGGGMAVMESTVGIVGNLFSYLRLMSLGFAGAILAGVANDFGEGAGLGVLMAILLHVVNVVVHTISPAIHSFRLNLLEGFNKFYEEGGKEYKPFMARR